MSALTLRLALFAFLAPIVASLVLVILPAVSIAALRRHRRLYSSPSLSNPSTSSDNYTYPSEVQP